MQERTLCAMLSPGPPRASRTRCAPTALRRVLRERLQPRCHAPSPLPQGGRGCPKGGRGSAFMPSPRVSPSSRKDGGRSPRLQPHRYRISRDAGAHPVRDAFRACRRASRTRCAPTALRRVLRERLQPRCHAPSPLPQGGRGCPKGGRGSAFMSSPSASPSSRNDGERSPRLQPPQAGFSRDVGAHPVRDALARPTKSIAHKVRSYGSAPGVAGAASAAMPRAIPSPARRERVPEGRERVRFHVVSQREPLKQERRRAFAAPAAAQAGFSRDVGAHPVRDAVARPTKSIAHKVRSYGSAPGVATFFAHPAPSRSRHVNLPPGVNKTPRGVRAGHGLAVAAGFARWHTVCIRGDAP